GVALAQKELRVVMKRIFHSAVNAKAIVAPVVVVIGFTALPFGGAFDAEMVVGLAGKCAISIARLEQCLRKLDAGRDAIPFHLGNSDILVLFDICQSR